MKKLTCLFFYVSSAIFAVDQSDLKEPYASVQILKEDPFGWYSNQKQMEKLLSNPKIKTVIEVGSWTGGGSTRHIGSILKTRNGRLYAVDTWLGSAEHTKDPKLKYIYEQFLSNMIHWDLTETVLPIRTDSLTAAQTLDVKPDLIYIDGDHSTKAVYADLCAWYPFIESEGIICGDDWVWESVRKGVMLFAKERSLKITHSGNFWILKKTL